VKIDKLKKFERSPVVAIPADTPEELAALIAELLLIAERMPLEKILPGEPTKHNSSDAKKIIPKNVTKHNLSDAEKKIPENLTVFNSEQLRILESLKDAEQ
jgi:hypothetical protein